jgi:hypothetical protein
MGEEAEEEEEEEHKGAMVRRRRRGGDEEEEEKEAEEFFTSFSGPRPKEMFSKNTGPNDAPPNGTAEDCVYVSHRVLSA